MKSILQPRIRDFVAWQLEHYPSNRSRLESIKRDLIPSPTPTYGGSEGHSTEAHRTTEDITVRISSSAYVRQLERTVDAIKYVIDRLDPLDMQLVELVYFRGSHTVSGAALVVNLSQTAAYYHINKILTAVALELGLVNDGY